MKSFGIFKSDFFKNTLWLTSGTTIAQAISFLTAPVLTRIYLPEDYGMLGLYMVFCTLIGTFSTFQYSNAIIISEDDSTAQNVLQLSLLINVIVTIVSAVGIIFTRHWISEVYKSPHLEDWILLAPLSLFFAGLNNIFSAWGVRKRAFKLLSKNRIYTALLSPVFSISIGYFLGGPLGLFVGLLISQILPTFRMSYFFFRHDNLRLNIHRENILMVVKRFSNFPKFSLPADFINNFSNQIPVMILSQVAGQSVIGWYGISVRMLVMPIALIANSIGDVFRQRAAKDYNESGSCRPIFLKVLKTLFLIAVIPFGLLILFAPEIFSFFFGLKWKGAGEITSVLGILYLFKFVVSPLSYVTYVAQKQWVSLLTDILLVITVGSIYYIGIQLRLEYKTILFIYALSYSFLYVLTLYLSYKFSVNKTVILKK
jgi:O-antigen/teichoic acid export membrane protein